MKSGYLLSLALVLLSTLANAQVAEKVLKGYLGLQGGESFTYEMEFKDSLGYIYGYANTYLDKNKEVRAAIEGTIDRKAQTVSFSETRILYNKGFESNTTICLIKAVLRYKKNSEGQFTLSGPITSADVGNVYCGMGTITFVDTDGIRRLFMDEERKQPTVPVQQTVAAKPPPSKPIRIIYDTARPVPRPAAPPLVNKEPEKITAGQDKYLNWYTDSLVIEIWDNSQEDGDVVSIQFNGQTILPKYSLTKQKKVLRIPVSTEKSEVRIIAGSEGSYPPNTVDILLLDGERTHRIVANNTIGKQAVIKLQKVNKP